MDASVGEDRRWMRRAAELARRGWGRVAPNPMVGAVVVRDGEPAGEGWHAEFGGPHAEVAALRAAGERARGSTLYVTLEPCAHTGKTPPCTRAILEAGVGRVVVGCRDPDPEAGGGAEELREAGVEVEVGVEGRTCARLDAPFFWTRTREIPFVALKLALSLDGALAERPGVRTRITGEEAGRRAHRLRAGFDAILVGRGTVEVDDPLLTVRGPIEPRRPPIRVVLDAELSTSPGARLVAGAAEAPTWLVCAPGAPADRRERLEAAGARVLEAPASEDGVDLRRTLKRLAAEGVGTVLAEGGARVAGSLLRRGLVQRLHLLYAPVLFGEDAPGGFGGFRSGRGHWRVVEREALGEDTLLTLESAELERRIDAWAEGG